MGDNTLADAIQDRPMHNTGNSLQNSRQDYNLVRPFFRTVDEVCQNVETQWNTEPSYWFVGPEVLMRKNKLFKVVENALNKVRKADEKEGIVGFVLFDTVKRAFVSFRRSSTIYTGNVEEASVLASRGEALDIMVSLDDFYDVKIVPLIHNELFGLSPLPGALDDYNKSDS
ncbi:hypothetical protein PF919_004693 [Salmonella enterica]|nr:hypothetical protein [Salmonella enterica subsp. enterica serovar Paratyphi B]EDZ8770725.1 hypothetical protein [Salmonella enterica subsp. enterica serovar Adelaide]EIL4621245.1 hypothetical protein [Salmonella enterica]EEJ3303830.1 hypothetical protein [Salmonella enterica subsp. enterica serovar Paratyphi B]EHL2077080.1 hypothetical protein [Salmonella enterica subsp. enterica serovar Adelaide]